MRDTIVGNTSPTASSRSLAREAGKGAPAVLRAGRVRKARPVALAPDGEPDFFF
jgi:hypothetical protein